MKSSDQYVELAEEALQDASRVVDYKADADRARAGAMIANGYIELAKMALKIEAEE